MGPQQPALDELKRRACESVELNAARLGELSRSIWRRPELAYQEHHAHDAMTGFFSGAELPGAAWAVRPRYKLDTAFRAEWGTAAPGPRPLRVAFLCEYDALPGIGHACGHNLIAEVGAAAALGLKAALESLPQPAPVAVQVTVLGTPAEEQGGGKIDLINAGAFDGLDVVFMAHPSQENAAYLPDVAEHECYHVSEDTEFLCKANKRHSSEEFILGFILLDMLSVTVKYYGKASHAAAYPWEGVNALDAAVLAYNNLSVLRQQMKPTWRVHGEIFIKSDIQHVEIKGGKNDYYNVLPNKSLEKIYKENGKKLGIEFISEDCILNGLSGSTDFGNVTFVVPGLHPYFYIGSDALNHTEQYTEAAGSQNAQFYALRTAKALAMTALDVIFNPDLLEQVREDFRQVKLKEEGQLHPVVTDKKPDAGVGACASR
ncbi:hypothetical protein ASZ78_005311 [Callipepla squamata]|uniref:Peptidase M20 domain-containing protein 2 n=1 Tax=Callipepla squamata TaxID=9009 RepID=A0A226MW69_CALSU|nr:hypothetical protein ASZ78_005311 [Callipepla squamata]